MEKQIWIAEKEDQFIAEKSSKLYKKVGAFLNILLSQIQHNLA